MGNKKRTLLLAAGSLGILSLILGAAFAQPGVAHAAAAYDSTPITYIANPPMKLMHAGATLPKSPSGVQACVQTYGLACYGPSDIRTAYNIPDSATGAGQTIVIVDAYGSPTIRNDLQVFDAAFGLPNPTLNIFYPTGAPTYNPRQHHQESSWAFETSLDVEWSHAIAPAATIDLVIAANNGGNVLNLAQQYAISHHLGNVMSLSFGSPEAAIKGGGNNIQLMQAHANYVAAKAAGITVFSSAGDNGATDGTSVISANYPASDPLVTAVGGTNLFINYTNGSYANETVWNDGDDCPFGCTAGAFGATGGAPSVIFSAPSYQSALSGKSARTTSDVSYNASVYTGVLTYISFIPGQSGFYFTGGTSSGSPQWAAIVADADAMAGHSLGFLNPTLYAIGANPAEYAADFHDVTVGDNAFAGPGFAAGAGYDIPTGLGSPNVANLIPDLIK